MNHSTRGCADQFYVQGSELCRKPSFLFTSSLRRSLDWPEPVVCLGQWKEEQGALNNSYPAASACRSTAQCQNCGEAMAGKVVPDVVPDLTLSAATHPAVQMFSGPG